MIENARLDEIEPGDRLLIRQGDVVPVNGAVAPDVAFLDASALTGEPLPARLSRGADAMSSSTNAGDAFDLIATRIAKDSTYAGIVRLVEQAQRSKAPMARLAARALETAQARDPAALAAAPPASSMISAVICSCRTWR